MTNYLGELAALTASICWTFSSVFFTTAGRQVGSVTVNRMRLLLTTGLLILSHWLLLGAAWPGQVEPERWFWLILSGVVGLVVADGLLFQGFVWIGPQLTMVVFSLSPVLSALLAWLFLAETLTPLQITGMLLTIGGILWVILNRRHPVPTQRVYKFDQYGIGVLCAFGSALCQALALITAKKGLSGDFPTLSANLIRMAAALVVLWTFTLFQGQIGPIFRQLSQRRAALWQIMIATGVGPFIGIWVSLIAIRLTEVGIASTLMTLSPIFLLPVSHFVLGEKASWQAILGTIVAIGGVALLFLA